MTICRHCDRAIVEDPIDGWIDPEADGDDIIWREHCGDNHTERAAPHEPRPNPCSTCGADAVVTQERVDGPYTFCNHCGAEPSTSVPVRTEVPDVTTFALNATHRCDRCGAQAFVRTQHENGDLLWCGHHFAKYETKLDTSKVVDERAKINLAASISANST